MMPHSSPFTIGLLSARVIVAGLLLSLLHAAIAYREEDDLDQGRRLLSSRSQLQSHDGSARKEVTITAYWVRHAWSCANALKADRKFASEEQLAENKLQYNAYFDPPLTDYGVGEARRWGEIVRDAVAARHPGEEIPIFSSAMIRTMETALESYPDGKITPIPHIAEQSPLAPNVPMPLDEQKRRLAALRESDLPRVDFEELSGNEEKWRSQESKSNYEVFKRYFPDLVHRRLGGTVEDSDEAEVPVVIFAHAVLMRDNLPCGYEPSNNEAFVQKYKVRWGDEEAVLEPGECTPLFPREEGKFSKPPALLCEHEIERCKEVNGEKLPLPVLWLERDREKCKGE